MQAIQRHLLCSVIAAGVVTASVAATATDASVWTSERHSSMRLIAGAAPPRAALVHAGIEVKLDPGWKTYWRYPGDSGVPPRFDFDGSENVKTVAVRWPAPRHFVDDGGDTIGYKDQVIFPLEIVPVNAAKPVLLRLKLDYAVCEKLCIPAVGETELLLASGPSSHVAELKAAAALVPTAAKLDGRAPIAIRTVRRETGAGHDRVFVDVVAPPAAELELFVEGPTAEWALPLPKPIAGASAGLRRFAFDLEGIPPGASVPGAKLTLTLVAGQTAIEVATHLN